MMIVFSVCLVCSAVRLVDGAMNNEVWPAVTGSLCDCVLTPTEPGCDGRVATRLAMAALACGLQPTTSIINEQ